jgi:putative ABC transport system permease protein
VNARIAAQSFVLAFAAALIASAYPAWRAARLPIVDALRHNR